MQPCRWDPIRKQRHTSPSLVMPPALRRSSLRMADRFCWKVECVWRLVYNNADDAQKVGYSSERRYSTHMRYFTNPV
eukprot:1950003-Prymnesium_polylepis.1